MEGSSKMGLWGITLHKYNIFLNSLLAQKDSKNAKKVHFDLDHMIVTLKLLNHMKFRLSVLEKI